MEDLHVEWKVKSFALAKLASEAYARVTSGVCVSKLTLLEYCIVTNCFIPINKDAISGGWNQHANLQRSKIS